MRGAWRVALATCASLIASSARADDRRDAESAFEQGKELMAGGHYAAACGQFEHSLALAPGIGVRLWLADCYENEGRTASAYKQFIDAAGDADRAGDNRAVVARSRAEQLRPRLVSVLVTVERPRPDERIECDGQAIGSSRWGTPEPVDPGRHLVVARGPDRLPWEVSFDATAPGSTLTVVVPPLSPLVAVPPPSAVEVRREDPVEGQWVRPAGLVALGAGLLSLTATGVLGLLAAQSNAASKDEGCGAATCSSQGYDDRIRAIHEADVATGLFVAAAIVGVGGAAMVVLAPTRRVSISAAVSRADVRVSF